MHPKHSKRILHSVYNETAPSSPFFERLRAFFHARDEERDTENARTGNSGKVQWGHGFPLQIISGPESGRGNQAYFQPAGPEPISSPQKIPADKPFQSTEFLTKRGLYSKIGFNASVLPCSHKNSAPKVPVSYQRRARTSDDMSSFRPLKRAPYFCKIIKLDCKSAARQRNKNNSIPRRLSAGGSEPGLSPASCVRGDTFYGDTGLVNQSRQILGDSDHSNRISWHHLGHPERCYLPPRKEEGLTEKRSRGGSESRGLELGPGQETARKAKLRVFCNSSGKALHPTNAKGQQSPTGALAKENVPHTSDSIGGSAMVASELELVIPPFPTQSAGVCDNRRIEPGMGSAGWGQDNSTWVVPPPSKLAHKQKGIIRRLCCSSVICRRPERKVGLDPVRQPDGCVLHSKSRGHEIRLLMQAFDQPSQTDTQHGYSTVGALHSGSLQRSSRQSVQRQVVTGLAPFRICDSSDFSKMGYPSNRLICNSPLESGTSLCVEKCSGSFSLFYGRLQQEMELLPGVGLSAPVPSSQGSQPSQFGDGHIHSRSAKMGESVLESGHQVTGVSSSLSVAQPSTSSGGRADGHSPLSCPSFSFGGLENTGWSKCTAGWPQEDVELLERSWRKSSLKTYAAPWKGWLAWAKERDVAVNDPNPLAVARYLGYLHRVKKLAPSTIKLHKSAIATLANPIKRDNISNHVLVKQMLKAIEASRPVPNKKVIWDVNSLIAWMKEEMVDLNSIFQVSRRLALILLLASGRRLHDLTLLRINDMHMDEESVSLWPAFGSKTDKSSYRQSGWKLLRCSDQALCPVYWLKLLINRTTSRREARKDLTHLFITSRGKVAPASRAVIAGWVRTAFTSAGLVSSPGSIRSAVASSRWESDLPLDTILRNGNWKGKENFFKFYYKEVRKDLPPSTSGSELTQRVFSPL